MSKFFLKNFLIFLCFALSSCSILERNNSQRIRIVDLQGKDRGVKTRVPELNARILRSQGRMFNDGEFILNSQNNKLDNGGFAFNGASDSVAASEVSVKNKYPTADYEAASSELISQKKQVQSTSSESKIVLVNDTDNSKVKAGGVDDPKDIEVEYDLSKTQNTGPSKKTVVLGTYTFSKKSQKQPAKIYVKKSTKSLKGIFIQTGAFSSEENAKKSAAKMNKFAKSQIEESSQDNKKIYRVLLGSFSGTSKANQAIRKIKSADYDAIIVRKQ